MTLIVETVTIDADMEAVFDLISRAEKFPLYADFLTEVRKIDDRTYRGVARGRRITLTWDSDHHRISAARPAGMAINSGLAELGRLHADALDARHDGRSILIEYHLPGEFLERWLRRSRLPSLAPWLHGFLRESGGSSSPAFRQTGKRRPPQNLGTNAYGAAAASLGARATLALAASIGRSSAAGHERKSRPAAASASHPQLPEPRARAPSAVGNRRRSAV